MLLFRTFDEKLCRREVINSGDFDTSSCWNNSKCLVRTFTSIWEDMMLKVTLSSGRFSGLLFRYFHSEICNTEDVFVKLSYILYSLMTGHSQNDCSLFMNALTKGGYSCFPFELFDRVVWMKRIKAHIYAFSIILVAKNSRTQSILWKRLTIDACNFDIMQNETVTIL